MSDDALVSVTMTRGAALKFYRALISGSVRVSDDETAEWLRWGASRVAYASPEVIDPEGFS